jgi:hypothetical protein
MKTKKLYLRFQVNLPDNTTYRVEEIVNSVDYVPGQTLVKSEVEILCKKQDWTVVIKPEH